MSSDAPGTGAILHRLIPQSVRPINQNNSAPSLKAEIPVTTVSKILTEKIYSISQKQLREQISS